MEKPTLPKGTRDFGPAQMAKRQFIFDNIKKVFQKYGFQPLETPAMENLSTLTGKYGDEGDQLLFKIVESGDYLGEVKQRLSQDLDFYVNFKNQIELKEWPQTRDFIKDVLEKIRNEVVRQSQSKEIETATIQKAISSQISLITDSKNRFPIYVLRALNYLLTQHEVVSENLLNYFSKTKTTESTNDLDRLINEIGENNRASNSILQDFNSKAILKDISTKGLRYDLTVPFARYVVMNRGEMTFPFKRYQIQPVWRADRPQKGRYREFYQCDADVVGTDSLICEAEIILMIKEVFTALGIADYTIKVNHRGILSGLAELTGTTNETSLFVAIDKLDKIGEQKVREELIGKGFTTESLDMVFEILNFKGTTTDKIKLLTERFTSSPSGVKGITDFSAVLQLLTDYGVNDEHVEFDIALARGLSYYTGCIFEVKINNVAIGSVSGGGRYDNLTQAFGIKERLSGVGISFGIDRIYDAMEEVEKMLNKKLFPDASTVSSKVLICHFDEESKRYGLKVLNTLRNSSIASEIYPDTVKINKQLDYANKKMIPYTIVIGSDEVKSGVLTLKDMRAGEQSKLLLEDILNKLTVDN